MLREYRSFLQKIKHIQKQYTNIIHTTTYIINHLHCINTLPCINILPCMNTLPKPRLRLG